MDSSKKKKITIISAIAGAIILIAAGAIVFILNRPVKVPDPQSGKAARDFLASDKFRKLTPQQQSNFVRRMRPARRPTPAEMQQMRKEMQAMSPEKRRAMRDNMRRVFMREQEERLDKFFKMSKAEQLAELDRRIAEQDKRRAQRQNQRRNNNNTQNAAANANNNPPAQTAANNQNNNQRRRRPTAQMRREFESAISPAARAKYQQYRQMERLRRQGKLK